MVRSPNPKDLESSPTTRKEQESSSDTAQSMPNLFIASNTSLVAGGNTHTFEQHMAPNTGAKVSPYNLAMPLSRPTSSQLMPPPTFKGVGKGQRNIVDSRSQPQINGSVKFPQPHALLIDARQSNTPMRSIKRPISVGVPQLGLHEPNSASYMSHDSSRSHQPQAGMSTPRHKVLVGAPVHRNTLSDISQNMPSALFYDEKGPGYSSNPAKELKHYYQSFAREHSMTSQQQQQDRDRCRLASQSSPAGNLAKHQTYDREFKPAQVIEPLLQKIRPDGRSSTFSGGDITAKKPLYSLSFIEHPDAVINDDVRNGSGHQRQHSSMTMQAPATPRFSKYATGDLSTTPRQIIHKEQHRLSSSRQPLRHPSASVAPYQLLDAFRIQKNLISQYPSTNRQIRPVSVSQGPLRLGARSSRGVVTSRRRVVR